MRGLKHIVVEHNRCRNDVASFTDAWIETEINDINEHVNLVASFTDAWIETVDSTTIFQPQTCRIFYRCVD